MEGQGQEVQDPDLEVQGQGQEVQDQDLAVQGQDQEVQDQNLAVQGQRQAVLGQGQDLDQVQEKVDQEVIQILVDERRGGLWVVTRKIRMGE